MGSIPVSVTKKMNKIFRTPKLQMIIFLLLLSISAIIHYSFISYLQAFLVALVSTIMFDLAFLRLRKVALFFPYSAIITGVIIGLIASPYLSWYQLIITAGLAMFSKNYLLFKNRHIFNPAAFGLFFSHLIFSNTISWWAVSWQQLNVQNLSAIIYILILLLPGLVSIVRMRRFVNILAFYITYALLNQTIFDPTAIFFAFVMLPEPMTTPSKRTDQFLFGISIAVLSFIIRFPLPDVFTPVLLLGNLIFITIKVKSRMNI